MPESSTAMVVEPVAQRVPGEAMPGTPASAHGGHSTSRVDVDDEVDRIEAEPMEIGAELAVAVDHMGDDAVDLDSAPRSP